MAEDFLHKETALKLPAKSKASKQGEIGEYPSEVGKGFSIPFHADGFESSVFIKRIERDGKVTTLELAQESIAAVKEIESNGHYAGVKICKSDGKYGRPKN